MYPDDKHLKFIQDFESIFKFIQRLTKDKEEPAASIAKVQYVHVLRLPHRQRPRKSKYQSFSCVKLVRQ